MDTPSQLVWLDKPWYTEWYTTKALWKLVWILCASGARFSSVQRLLQMGWHCLVSSDFPMISLCATFDAISGILRSVDFSFNVGTNLDPGIGNDAAKVVADCIHSSRVKEMGQALLQKNTNVSEVDDFGDPLHSYDRLSDEDVKKLQLKLARSLVVFMELLHLLIARNRDLLLDVIQERKKLEPGGSSAYHTYTRSLTREFVSAANSEATPRSFARKRSIGPASYDSASSQDGGRSRGEESARSHPLHLRSRSASGDDYGTGSGSTAGHTEKVRTDSAIAVQSELQRAFISLAKALHTMILGIMGTSETPRWLKLCCQENYFSAYTYRQTKIRK